MLKKRILFALIFAALQVASAAASAESPAKASRPVAATPEFRHEFGSVVEGMDIEHEFVVKNEGDADLLIEKVAPG